MGRRVESHDAPAHPRASLITDFYSYNTNMMAGRTGLPDVNQVDGAWMQPHWVGDLTLQADLEVKKATPRAVEARLELIRAGIPHRCTIDLATGTAVATRGETELGRWETPVKGTGKHHVDFANVDGRLSLSVDGRAAEATD